MARNKTTHKETIDREVKQAKAALELVSINLDQFADGVSLALPLALNNLLVVATDLSALIRNIQQADQTEYSVGYPSCGG